MVVVRTAVVALVLALGLARLASCCSRCELGAVEAGAADWHGSGGGAGGVGLMIRARAGAADSYERIVVLIVVLILGLAR